MVRACDSGTADGAVWPCTATPNKKGMLVLVLVLVSVYGIYFAVNFRCGMMYVCMCVCV